MDSRNPWVTVTEDESAEPTVEPVEQVPLTGPEAPQPGLTVPEVHLPSRVWPEPAVLWWVGVHGGAGESTLAALVPGSRPAEHAWPVVDGPDRPAVVLVTRTHAHGLGALQRAATAWGAGAVEVTLLGAALVADAPGRLPRPLRDLARHVSGAVPRVWDLPWVEAWRLGHEATLQDSPRAVRNFIRDLTVVIPLKENSEDDGVHGRSGLGA